MRKTYFLAIITLLFLCSNSENAYSQTLDNENLILGKWLAPNGKTAIKIYKNNGLYDGRITWLIDPYDDHGKQVTDVNNPDEELRMVPLMNLVILKDLKYKGKANWSGGNLYMPKSGKTYNCKIKLIDKYTMEVSAYVGLKALGKTLIWKRK